MMREQERAERGPQGQLGGRGGVHETERPARRQGGRACMHADQQVREGQGVMHACR